MINPVDFDSSHQFVQPMGDGGQNVDHQYHQQHHRECVVYASGEMHQQHQQYWQCQIEQNGQYQHHEYEQQQQQQFHPQQNGQQVVQEKRQEDVCQEGIVSSTASPRRSSSISEVNLASTVAAKPSKKTKKGTSTKRKKSSYKHVPHRDKPAHLVAKRNARERRRVHAVNLAFVRLRKAVPFENKRGKRVSKVRILQRALDYIQNLREMIAEVDGVAYQKEEEENIARKDDSLLFDF